MATQAKDLPQAANAQRPTVDAAEVAERAGAAVTTIHRHMQGSVIDAVRRGQGSSLHALQAWADLSRLVTRSADASDARVLVTGAHDMFETLLAAQRQLVDDLIAAQRAFAVQLFDVAQPPRAGH